MGLFNCIGITSYDYKMSDRQFVTAFVTKIHLLLTEGYEYCYLLCMHQKFEVKKLAYSSGEKISKCY